MKTSALIVLLVTAVTVFSCKNSSDYRTLDAESSDMDMVAADSVTATQPKLIKTADISFKVKNVAQTCEKVSALTGQYKGLVTHHQMQSYLAASREIDLGNDSLIKVSCFTTKADMTLKLPTEKLEDFMNKVSHMSTYVTMRRMDIEDKSLDYLESQLKLNSRNELVRQQKSGRIVIKKPEDVLYFKDQLVDEQIYKYRIDDAVKYSVISLDFHESNTILKETIANDDPASYQIPFWSRLGLAINNGFQIFINVIVGLTNLWVFAVLGLLTWFGYNIYKKKRVITPVTK